VGATALAEVRARLTRASPGKTLAMSKAADSLSRHAPRKLPACAVTSSHVRPAMSRVTILTTSSQPATRRQAFHLQASRRVATAVTTEDAPVAAVAVVAAPEAAVAMDHAGQAARAHLTVVKRL
jgi:hypothetical protein